MSPTISINNLADKRRTREDIVDILFQFLSVFVKFIIFPLKKKS